MADGYLRRTAITRVDLGAAQRAMLEATIAEWQSACNIASRIGWSVDETRRTNLQRLAYDDIREETSLGSQHTILAIRQAAAALEGIAELDSKEEEYETSCPVFSSETIVFDARTMTIFEDETVSLATVDGRIRCELSLPNDEDGYQYQYLDCWDVTESTLTKRDGEFYLHIGFRKQQSSVEREPDRHDEDRTVLGVDLGIVTIATTSTAYFASGRELRHRHEEFERIRGNLARTGTPSAYRTLRRLSGRESRYVRDVLHRVANDLVDEATAYGCTHIVFEDLRHIREDAPPIDHFHKWAHRQLVDLVTYKAEAEGISIDFVSPEYTSRRCPDCGHTSVDNRPTQSLFDCDRCETTGNADYIAAKNVGLRYVRRGQQSSRRTGDSQLALKSGTVTPNRGFVPYADR